MLEKKINDHLHMLRWLIDRFVDRSDNDSPERLGWHLQEELTELRFTLSAFLRDRESCDECADRAEGDASLAVKRAVDDYGEDLSYDDLSKDLS